MKVLVFCNNKSAAQIVFELIRKRVFAGIVLPAENTELINDILDSGYIQEQQLFTLALENCTELIEIVKSVNPDVCFTLTFPLIFKKEILDIPSQGFYNFHFGKLPEYRSADPIFWQIRNREKTGGLCVHKMNSRIDAGPVLFQEGIPIHSTDTYGSLLHKSAVLSSIKVGEILKLIEAEDGKLITQNPKGSKYYPKPKLEDVNIDWKNMESAEIIATINAANPWNKGAITTISGEEIRILQATPVNYDKELPDQPGLVFYADEKQGVFVICKDQQLLRIDAIYTPLGFSFGGRILSYGLIKGKVFE